MLTVDSRTTGMSVLIPLKKEEYADKLFSIPNMGLEELDNFEDKIVGLSNYLNVKVLEKYSTFERELCIKKSYDDKALIIYYPSSLSRGEKHYEIYEKEIMKEVLYSILMELLDVNTIEEVEKISKEKNIGLSGFNGY